MHRLLSLLGALLTLFTAIGVLLLLLGPPPPPQTSLNELAPEAGPRPDDEAGRDGSAMDFALAIARRAAAVDVDWLAPLARLVAPEGIGLRGARVVLTQTPRGVPLALVLDRVTVLEASEGTLLRFEGRVGETPSLPIEGVATVRDGVVAAQMRLHEAAAVPFWLGLDGAGVEGGPWFLELRTTTAFETVRLVVRTGSEVRLQAAGMPRALTVRTLEAALTWRTGTETIVVDRLAMAADALRLNAQGQVGRERLALTVAVSDVDAAAAGDLWPPDIARGARQWVTANIPHGSIERLDLRLDLDAAALAGDIAPGAVYGEARIRDAEIHFLRPMPPVTGAAATAVFDADRLVFDIAAGTLEGIDVTGGEVVVADYGDATTVERLETRIEARGSVPTILAVVDHEPLTLATRHDLPKGASEGAGSFTVEVALPLLNDLALDDVDLRFAGAFENVALPGMAAGRDLRGATVRLEATPDRVSAEGSGRIAGVPLDFTYRLDTVADTETLTASGRVEAAALANLGLPPGLPVSGPVGLEASMSLAGAEDRTVAELDLVDAEVDVPWLGLWKPSGIEGDLAVRIVEGPAYLRVERLAAVWSGFQIEARALLDANGVIRELAIDPLRMARTDLTAEAVTRDGTLEVQVTGERLDLGPLLRAQPPSGAAGAPSMPSLHIRWQIAEVVAGGNASLRDATGEARFEDGLLHRLRMRAATAAAPNALEVDVRPEDDDGQAVTLVSRDAGGVLRALDLSDALMGGRLSLEGRLLQQRPTLRMAGEIRAENLDIEGVPPIIRRLASVPAIAGLPAETLNVSLFTSPFHVEDSVLTLEDAAIEAADLAIRVRGDVHLASHHLDLQGSLAPLATVNRFIGSIPVLGNILQGSREAGAFAVSFSIEGPREDPTVVVNPFSVVTPGVLQDLFEGIELKPPRIPEN